MFGQPWDSQEGVFKKVYPSRHFNGDRIETAAEFRKKKPDTKTNSVAEQNANTGHQQQRQVSKPKAKAIPRVTATYEWRHLCAYLVMSVIIIEEGNNK
jgi:hypothetical protein